MRGGLKVLVASDSRRARLGRRGRGLRRGRAGGGARELQAGGAAGVAVGGEDRDGGARWRRGVGGCCGR